MSQNFEIATELMPYLADAVVRFRYLYPGVNVTIDGAAVVASGDGLVSASEIEQQFMFCLYRQKIYVETLPLRRTLIAGVVGR